MTKFRISLIFIVLTGFLFFSCNRNIAQSKESKQYYYDCPMHPDDVYYLPGKCPKCGMTLEQWELDNKSRTNSGNSHNDNFGTGGHSGGCH